MIELISIYLRPKKINTQKQILFELINYHYYGKYNAIKQNGVK